MEPSPWSEPAQIRVRERLNCLAICCYVRGGVMVLFSCFFLIYVGFFAAVSFIPESAWNLPSPTPPPASAAATRSGSASFPRAAHPANPGPPPVIVFRILAGVMSVFVLAGFSIGALTAYAGRCLQKRRRKGLIYTMAALNCPFIPYGITLGIFIFIVMSSPAAVEEFKRSVR